MNNEASFSQTYTMLQPCIPQTLGLKIRFQFQPYTDFNCFSIKLLHSEVWPRGKFASLGGILQIDRAKRRGIEKHNLMMQLAVATTFHLPW